MTFRTLRNLHDGWRALRRHPGTSVLAVLALSTGIGLATTIFSIVDGALLGELPFEEAGEIVLLTRTTMPSIWVPPHDYLRYRAEQSSFEGLAAYRLASMNLADDDAWPERYDGCYLAHEAFSLLGLRTVLGRAFTAEDDTPGAPLVALVAHHVWRSRFRADPGVVGREIRVNGELATVVGVLPPGIRFPIRQEIFLPLRLGESPLPGEGAPLAVFGRLRDGVGFGAAQAEIDAVNARLDALRPPIDDGRVVVEPYTLFFVAPVFRNFFWTLFAAAFLLLAIACTKAGSLLLVQALASHHELVIRTALGARRRDVTGQIIAQSFLVTLFGAAGGLVLAFGGVRLFAIGQRGLPLPFWMEFTLDGRTFAFAAAIGLATVLAAGLYPALRAAHDAEDVGSALHGGGRGTVGGSLTRMGRLLVAFDVALAMALLVPTVLLARSLTDLRRIDFGIEPESVMTARISLPPADYPEESDRAAFAERLTEALAECQETLSAAVTTHLPTYHRGRRLRYALAEKSYDAPEDYPWTLQVAVTPGFFELLGVPLLQGRLFTLQDHRESGRVAIVNQSFASLAWPGESPVGRRLRFGRGETEEPWRTVVGLVPDAWMGYLDDQDQAGVYTPYAQTPTATFNVMVGLRDDSDSFAETLRRQLHGLDAGLPVYEVRTMATVLDLARSNHEMFGGFFSSFGVAALVLSSLGFYGVLASTVRRRTREMGLRMALGARRGEIRGMIVGEGLRGFLPGLAAGLVLAAFTSRLASGFLYGVEATDPGTFTATALAFTGIALAASLAPAWRASRSDPATALRHE